MDESGMEKEKEVTLSLSRKSMEGKKLMSRSDLIKSTLVITWENRTNAFFR